MIKIRKYKQQDIHEIMNLQEKYAARYPDYIIRDREIFRQHPAFQGGQNIFCAFQKGKMVGYSALFPDLAGKSSPVAKNCKIWFDIIIDPSFSHREKVRELILDKVIEKSREIKNEYSISQVELAVCKFASELPSVDFYQKRNFVQKDLNLLMLKQLDGESLAIEVPQGLSFQNWQLKTKEQKNKYLKARNLAFPDSQMDLVDLNWFLSGLNQGLAIVALQKKEKVVGGCFVYLVEEKVGVIEDLFTVPDWRRKGIAQKTVQSVFTYAREKNMTQLELEVSNKKQGVVELYKKAGFRVVKREVELGKKI
ncbi:MAG: GNAT family N-acetyltransferase [bacterium]